MRDEIDQTFRESWRLLVHRNRRYLSELQDAEDAVQNAFLAALEDESSPGNRAWITTVSGRRAADEARRQCAQRRSVARLSGQHREDDGRDFTEEHADRAAALQTVRGFGELPRSTQSVLRLVADGHTTTEVAATLGLTVRSIESHLLRGRRHARESLVKAGVG